jgi:NitT/TauT family transport system substrate-binding protein
MLFCALAIVGGLALLPLAAKAEVAEINLAQQYGIAFLPLMLMESDHLVEKQVVKQGLPEPQVKWVKTAGPSAMNEAILSGALQYAATGVPSLGLLWDRTKGNLGLKAVAGVTSYSLWLNTRNPRVHTIRDFTEKDKIAVPSVKISTQAIILEIAAEKEFGVGKHTALDAFTVSLSHPDAFAALMAGTEVDAHFASSPFHEQEIKNPAIHTVMKSDDILGGPATNIVLTTTERFRSSNPKSFAAVRAALAEAIDQLNADKHAAAVLYLKLSGDKSPVEEIYAEMTDSGFVYTMTPQKVGIPLAFMHRIGSIKSDIASWRDLFFPEAHDLPGD